MSASDSSLESGSGAGPRDRAARCPRCGGRKLPELGGNCPNCLLGLGASEAGGTSGATGEAGRVGGRGEETSRLSGDRPDHQRDVPGWIAVPQLTGFTVLAEIARGGMGVVYRARQLNLKRLVAVKVLLNGAFASPAFLQRFQREAEVAATLNHPHIVSVYDVGAVDGRPYLSMELIEGRSLGEMVRDQPLPARSAARIVQQIAEAVQYAHDRGVLHRDLKPSNVLVDAQGEPHVTDFGLAKKFEPLSVGAAGSAAVGLALADLTLTGEVLGSPNYMPPEQADPSRGPTTAAGDVYSIGAILYHVLTGRPAFLADSVAQTLRLVLETEPVAPRLLNPELSRDLETICLKCLEKEPRLRYGSAGEIAAELGRYLRGEPIEANPVSWCGRLRRWCWRKPALAASLAAGAFLLMVVAGGSPIAALRINAERERAEAARNLEAGLRARAEAAERATQRQLYAALLEQARANTRSGELGQRVRALEAIRRAASISNTVELRREAMAAVSLPDLELARTLPYPGTYTLRELDPKFERIALARGPRPVSVCSVTNGQVLATLPPSTNLAAYVAEWSPDGRYLAVKRDLVNGGARADLEVWDVSAQRQVYLSRDLPWGAMNFHPRHPTWWLAAGDHHLSLVDLESGAEIRRLPAPGPTDSVRFSHDGGRLAVVHWVGLQWTLSILDATNGAPLVSREFAKAGLQPVRWSRGDRFVVVPLDSGVIHWMDPTTGQLGEIGVHKADATQVDFSPDGDYLFTASWDREVICWDGWSWRRLFSARADGYAARVSEDGSTCALLKDDGVALYRLLRPAALRELTPAGRKIRHATFSRDGRWLAASSETGVSVWNFAESAVPARDERAFDARPDFTDDGLELYASRSSVGNAGAYRWRLHAATNAAAGPALERLPLAFPEDFTFLSLHSNQVYLTSERGTAVLRGEQLGLDLDAGMWKKTSPGISGVSPDGRWLGIYRPYGHALYIYRLPGLERVTKLEHPLRVAGFEFLPHSDEVLICSRFATEFWNTSTWSRSRAVTNIAGRSVFYTPGGNAFWLRRDQDPGLFDHQSLEPLLLLPDGMAPLNTSSDGRLLVVSVDGSRLQVWDLAQLRSILRGLDADWTEPRATNAISRPAG